jgi:hypothetical protein
MTTENPKREKARDLYHQGLSYAEIATRLSASKVSIGKWCKDLAAQKRAAVVTDRSRTCPVCLKPFYASHKETQTCSRSCRTKLRHRTTGHWAKKRELVTKIYDHTCEVCERPFQSKLKNSDVCPRQECWDIIRAAL